MDKCFTFLRCHQALIDQKKNQDKDQDKETGSPSASLQKLAEPSQELDKLQKPDVPLRILLVDDDDDNHLIAKLFMKKLPIKIETSEDGADAVDKFMSGDYDLVLMDMQMPVMDGYEAAHEIRLFEKEKGKKETPIIALSAYTTSEEIQKSIDAGCTDHLNKPIMQQDLLGMISKYSKLKNHRIS